jgi:hypothetical protein
MKLVQLCILMSVWPARLFSRQLTLELRVAKYVPDIAKLIELQGNPEAFIQRPDWIFKNVSRRFALVTRLILG